MFEQRSSAIKKILSANDTGETGGHQAGILVPKQPEILSFFPELNPNVKNPRFHLRFLDQDGDSWIFAFIYYNNSLFGGTRNEYRLTRMTEYIRMYSLIAGDEIIMKRDGAGIYHVNYQKIDRPSTVQTQVLRLSSSWKVIKI